MHIELDRIDARLLLIILSFLQRRKFSIKNAMRARGADFGTGGKFVFLADLARLCLCIVYWM